MNSADKHDFEELMFWGRIEGMQNDYYICLGVTYTDKYEFPEKRFYWASSADFKFNKFDKLNDQHFQTFAQVSGMFTGDPKKVLINVEPPKPDAQEGGAEGSADVPVPAEPVEKDPLASTEEEDPNANFQPRNLIEQDRLQFTVFAIENDCHIIPKGSYKLTDQHEIHRNNAYRGMDVESALLPASYMHFRSAQDHVKKAGLEKDDCVFKTDFLDEASNQLFKGALTGVKAGTKQNVALLRNHVWPGFTTFSVAGSKNFGSFYFGEGIKNMDLTFQI